MALDKAGATAVKVAAPVQNRTVLVVDDSRAQRLVLCRLLTNQGYEVIEAGSGREALEVCQAQPPDLVISDWMMPEMNGIEFCHEFRKMTRESYGYFILLTSRDEKGDVTQGFDAGADDFLTKPVNGDDLRARLRAGERVLSMERELHEKNRLIRSTLDELQVMHDAINSDLIEARKLQISLVAEHHRDFGHAEVSLLLRPAGHVGGDLVGMFPVDGQHLGVFGIDVSGHGISSALMTARLAGYLSATAPSQNIALKKGSAGGYRARCPAETVARLNALVMGELETEHYFTLFLGILDQNTGAFSFAQAGHPNPLIQRASGSVEMLGNGGLPVGLINTAEYELCMTRLHPGDRLLIYSDGMSECRDQQGKLLGEDGLGLSLMQHARKAGQECLQALTDDLECYQGHSEFDDDISAVLLELKSDQGTD